MWSEKSAIPVTFWFINPLCHTKAKSCISRYSVSLLCSFLLHVSFFLILHMLRMDSLKKARGAPPPFSVKFLSCSCSFFREIWPNNKFAYIRPGVGTHVWEILDPSQLKQQFEITYLLTWNTEKCQLKVIFVWLKENELRSREPTVIPSFAQTKRKDLRTSAIFVLVHRSTS